MKPASVIIMDEHPIVRMSIEVLLQKNKNIVSSSSLAIAMKFLTVYATMRSIW
jgi:DNA-binding NarL/FixJ family response regulator